MRREDREKRETLKKERLKADRRQFELSLYENKQHSIERARKNHDKILSEADNINIKRDYFKVLKNEEAKKEEEEAKHLLLSKIMSNTDKLKLLKT